jgi:hemerythrin-like domain-containing protein
MHEKAASTLREIESLEADHRAADDLHVAVDRLYSDWAAGKPMSRVDEQKLRAATQRLKQLYEGHIKIEENLVFPTAKESLDKAALAAIGDEFRQRRK